jgi:tol-pal system protein YbgF
MTVKTSLVSVLTLVAVAVSADPAPVADLTRSSGQASSTAVRGGSVSDRLTALERLVEARSSAQLAMQQQLESLLTEVSELRGTTEEHSYKLEQILQQQRDIYQEIDRRLGGAAAGAVASQQSTTGPVQSAVVPAGNPAAVVAADEVATTQSAPAASAQMTESQAYEQAINFVVKDRDYTAAIPAFESFIKNYPKSEYTSTSHYWLGQLYYQKNELDTAKKHFNLVVKQYPNSGKVPDALLKLGQVAERQNDVALAKKYYSQLVRSFPNSKPAATAKAKLDAK